MPENAALPIVLALQVCRRVIRDTMNGEHSIIGITAEFALVAFPMPIQSFFIFAELTGIHGDLDLMFRVVEASDERPPLAEIRSGPMPTTDPLGVAHIGIALEGLVFREPGDYRVQMSSRGTLLVERKFKIVQLKL